jgi:exosortase/archaeosortase family protein
MAKGISGKLNHYYQKYHLYAFKDVTIFIIILLIFHVLWRTFVGDIMSVDFIRNSANALAREVFVHASWFLSLVGTDITPFDELNIGGGLKQNVFFYAENNGAVYVNLSCSGLKQFYQWFFLILLYPGPWKHKLWFIPFGIVIVHLVNVFRIVSMVWVTMLIPQHWDFMHDWVLRPFFYVVMFFLWVWWNEKFYLPTKKKKAGK